MKYALIILLLIVTVFSIGVFVSRHEEGISGESTVIGHSLVVAEYGYAGGGDRLLYAVIRSFPTNASDEQKSQDPRYRETQSGALVRDNDGRMIRVGRDGAIYLFDGDRLRTMKVKVGEADIGIANCQSIDEIWARFQRFEVHTNN